MSELSVRIFSQYLIQGVWAIILALLFLYTFRIYKRHYLKLWAWSWLAFSMYMLTSGLHLYSTWIYSIYNPIRITLSATSISFAYIEASLLLIGTWELVRNRKFASAHLRLIMIISILLAIASSVLFIDNSQISENRFFIRVGLRSLIMGCAFFITGIWMITNLSHDKSLGKRLLIIAFIIYGSEQFNYFLVGFLPIINVHLKFPYIQYLGLLDFFLEALIGMGMAIWLLENERKELERANDDLDHFFYSTSHDLRSPLASITGLVTLGKVHIKDESALEFFDKIEGRVNKLDSVIDDIISYAKSAKYQLKIEPLNFKEIVKEIETNLEFNKGATHIDFICESSEEVFLSDKLKITTILHNLITNSIKYHDFHKDNPYIKVSLVKDQGRVYISVEDNGRGIKQENHQQIFEMFYRASGDSVGSGLGLYIVKEAAKKLNGKVSVQSTYGKGSCFKVSLPALAG
ncbi:sensor histidine kinase [Fulvivirga sediminis]|uniref:histidine kinase n=1 Tax=Fulvivirga sediminis TaxID=2803949 RepID=A0A937F5C4_9BACT|nr:HAMP domain-containing sensor histidine kinase [Fulvivirga sediminis]MBL3654615.1 HAMP domain-containing histidine kinase [Fulvivirga sediminis]